MLEFHIQSWGVIPTLVLYKRKSIRNFVVSEKNNKYKYYKLQLYSNVINMKYKHLSKIITAFIDSVEVAGGFDSDIILQQGQELSG